MTPKFIFDTIESHLKGRGDIWHIVNGPKREVWFNAESIAALSRKDSSTFAKGFRVYGEENFSQLAELLDGLGALATITSTTEGAMRIPDISVLENLNGAEPPILTVIESKLISPSSTKRDDDVEMKSDFASQLHTLTTTKNSDGLLEQLDRAKRLIPDAQVWGLVFGVFRLGQCDVALARNFFSSLKDAIDSLYTCTNWKLWDEGIQPLHGLQDVSPHNRDLTGSCSIGLGIIEPRVDE